MKTHARTSLFDFEVYGKTYWISAHFKTCAHEAFARKSDQTGSQSLVSVASAYIEIHVTPRPVAYFLSIKTLIFRMQNQFFTLF